MLKRILTATAVVAMLTGAAAAAETPRKGGTLRYVAPYGSTFANMDIHTSQRVQDSLWAWAIHRALYIWDSKANEPKLALATSVETSPDGLTHTFKLREDAYFHNGRQMTADDIIWSYTRIMDPEKAYPGARYIRTIEGAVAVEQGKAETISGLKKIDDHTLQITMTQKGDPGYQLMEVMTAIYPAKEAQEEGFITNPIGLGPFKFVEYLPGSRFVAERFDKYYEEGKPYADKIVVSIMGDAAARDVAFRNKEIDVNILGPVQYVAYQNDPELSKHLLEVAEMFTRNMGMNPDFKPFSDKRVRQAINYAINTKLIIEKLVKGKAIQATSWLSPTSPAYSKDLKPYPYDPEKAKELLAEAGYADGFEFEWTTSQNESWGQPIVEAVIPMLAKVGIKVKIKPVEATILGETVTKGDFQAYIWSNRSGPDPLAVLQCYHSEKPQSDCNYVKFNNPAYDKLLDEAALTDDKAKKIELLKQANEMLYEEAPLWFFNYNKAVMAYQPWIHGLQQNATELSQQQYEEIWIDESSPAAN